MYNDFGIGIITVDPKQKPNVKYDLARNFIGFATGKGGQEIVANLRICAEPPSFTMDPAGK